MQPLPSHMVFHAGSELVETRMLHMTGITACNVPLTLLAAVSLCRSLLLLPFPCFLKVCAASTCSTHTHTCIKVADLLRGELALAARQELRLVAGHRRLNARLECRRILRLIGHL